MKTSINRVSIVGTGPVAKSFAFLVTVHPAFELDFIVGRSLDSAKDALKDLSFGVPSHNLKDLALSDLVFLAVPDDQIKSLASDISTLGKHFTKKSYSFCHFSGAYSSDILNELKTLESCDREIYLSSIHPLISFSKAITNVNQLRGASIAVEGEGEIVKDFLNGLDFKPFSISNNQKLKYHAAAVFCSNYLLTVLNAGIEILKEVDEEIDTSAFFDLAVQSINNARNSTPQAALTGPVERGDVSLVLSQLEELSSSTIYGDFYRELARETLKIAQNKDIQSKKTALYKDLEDILQ